MSSIMQQQGPKDTHTQDPLSLCLALHWLQNKTKNHTALSPLGRCSRRCLGSLFSLLTSLPCFSLVDKTHTIVSLSLLRLVLSPQTQGRPSLSLFLVLRAIAPTLPSSLVSSLSLLPSSPLQQLAASFSTSPQVSDQ